MMPTPVLIVGRNPSHRDILSSIAASCGLRSVQRGTIEAAQDFLARHNATAVL